MDNASPTADNDIPLNPCWDPWILKEAAGYRLFYLSGRTDQEPWWKTSWICEATSSDMKGWTHLGPVLEPLAGDGWESGRLFAGSAYLRDSANAQPTYCLFYSAASKGDISKEAIGLATSTDGSRWQRLPQPLLSFEADTNIQGQTATDLGYAGRCNWSNHLHWRDPYIVQEPTTQQYHLFFCASLKGNANYQGGIGVAVADKLTGPYELRSPAAGPGIPTKENNPNEQDASGQDASASWPFYHLERPQIIYFQNRYHLFFSCFKDFVNPHWLEKVGASSVTDSTLYWYVSDSIDGPFEPSSELPIVPGSNDTGLYGTTFTPLPAVSDWVQMAEQTESRMGVLGWYHQDYRLAVGQEFSAVWTTSGLTIVDA